MIQLTENIFVGDNTDCFYNDRPDWVVVHACKFPCHANAVGYRGSLPQNHPKYLIHETDNHLYLNMVDMPNELMPKFTHPIVKAFLVYMNKHNKKKVLIHCNLGESRSPSLCMIYLAKAGIIDHSTHQAAVIAFRQFYPTYSPSVGMNLYLQHYWNELMQM